MSYCRFGEGDAYVCGNVGDKSLICYNCQLQHTIQIVCFGRSFQIKDNFVTKSRKQMVNHLLEHRKNGHRIPQAAIRRLKKEIENFGDEVDFIPNEDSCKE